MDEICDNFIKIFAPNMEKMRYPVRVLQKRIDAACRGLVYVSETDSPIEAIFEISKGDETLRKFVQSRVSSSDPLEELAASAFFERLTRDREWHSPEATRSVGRYRQLRKLMLDNLSDVTLFRAGRVRVDIFVIGRDAEGNIAGIRTTSVET